MHGQEEISSAPRIVATVLHATFLATATWILAGDGAATFRSGLGLAPHPAGNPQRHTLLLAFGAVLLLRMTLTHFVLLKRRFDWSELGGVALALLVYQVGFALLGTGATAPLGPADVLAVVLFVAGGVLNTGSELQRRAFKARPENRGRLYTGGLFRLARHVNYFGDTLWVAGWALATRNPWSAVAPVALAAGFVLAFIPSLSKHLEAHYGEQYEQWRRTTKALIPWVY